MSIFKQQTVVERIKRFCTSMPPEEPQIEENKQIINDKEIELEKLADDVAMGLSIMRQRLEKPNGQVSSE